MSISSSTRKAGPFACNGSTVAFPFAFKVFTTADVRVVLTDSNSVESDLALGTNYTVALNADQDANPGGTVTTTATYATGYKITLTSQVQNLQPVTLTNQGGFYPQVINNALDRLTIMAQQLAEQVSRAVKTSISSSSTPDQLLSDIGAAVTNASNSATAAAGSATNSANSATASANSATASANSAAAAAASVASLGLPLAVASGGTGSTTAQGARDALGAESRKNRIINGAMQCAQQSTSYALTTGVGYGSLDQWAAAQGGAANGVLQQSTNAPTGFRYSLKLGRNNGATQTGALQVQQALETNDSIPLQGKQVTLSFYAMKGANFSGGNLAVQLWSGTGVDQSVGSLAGAWTGASAPISQSQALTAGWVRYQFTGTVPTGATQLGVFFSYTPTGTAGADDNVYITGVQLEIGTAASDYDAATYQQDLARVQRQFIWCVPSNTNAIQHRHYGVAGNYYSMTQPFPVPMRVTPSFGLVGSWNVSNATGLAIQGSLFGAMLNWQAVATGDTYISNNGNTGYFANARL